VAIALLDVLSGFDEVMICEAYEIDGQTTRDLPSRCEDLAKAKPVLRAVPGWKEDITGVTTFSDLPQNAADYVSVISRLLERPVDLVSVGPDRTQTIFMDSWAGSPRCSF
jgi:adenylosuccinate synthase